MPIDRMFGFQPVAAFMVAGFVAATLAVLAPAWAAAGESPKPIGKFGQWEAFVDESKSGKICYAAALPTQSKNEPKGRGRAYTMVSDRPADKSFDTIGVTSGFPLKKGSPAMLDVGGNKFDLYTVGDTAWTRDDKAVLAGLLKGRSAIFVGYPDKGAPVADTYQLEGLAAARGVIDKACGK